MSPTFFGLLVKSVVSVADFSGCNKPSTSVLFFIEQWDVVKVTGAEEGRLLRYEEPKIYQIINTS